MIKAQLTVLLLALLVIPTPPMRTGAVDSFLGRADAIFVRRVIEQRSSWDEDQRLIWTDHVFEVKQWLKGGSAPIAIIKEVGGTIGGLTLTLSHPVKYHRDSSYLVFAEYKTQLRTLEGTAGQLPILEGTGGASFVKLSPQHPLADLSDHEGHSLQDLSVFSGRLKERIQH